MVLDGDENGGRVGQSLILNALLAVGGVSLFAIVAVDFTSVLARHLGLRILGAIEIVQILITVAISASILAATISGAHAAVHLLLARVGPRFRVVLERFSEAVSVLVFLILVSGGLWVVVDLWPLDERSDLLHIPIIPARLVWCAGLALSAVASFIALIRRPRLDPPSDV